MIHSALMKLGAMSGCHQMPERSFFIKGYQFPLCARCTGILIGELLAILLWFYYHLPCIIAVALILPMACDGIIQYMLFVMSNNRRRFITGLFAGYGLMTSYIHLFQLIAHWTANRT